MNSVQFSRSVVSVSLRPHGLQHPKPPCPSPTPKVYSNSCPLSRWCHLTISSSVIPFSSCPQSFPASGSFPMSRFFASGGQRIGVSASASVFPMNIQGNLLNDWLVGSPCCLLWCSSPWASLRTTYTEEEGPLLTTSLPTGEIWASWSSQEKKKIFPKCNHGSLFLVVKTHLKYLMRCQPATAEKWHVLTTTYLLILEFTSCDKYPARYEVFLFLLFHVI